eukprot:TRINITY_DN5342_c0_g1_i1.p3 TRINITY_DN5342_c0_g1~~TRINITY_DN5342_c0_g1_i1.p3  ORF type:complete len:151 (+),score=19.12 TRINITY_DN5342_c0_g1_i1:98-550(+)
MASPLNNSGNATASLQPPPGRTTSTAHSSTAAAYGLNNGGGGLGATGMLLGGFSARTNNDPADPHPPQVPGQWQGPPTTTGGGTTTGQPSELDRLPIRAYLDQTVVPLLLQGLAALVRERPENPVDYLAAYLIKNNPQKSHVSTAETRLP